MRKTTIVSLAILQKRAPCKVSRCATNMQSPIHANATVMLSCMDGHGSTLQQTRQEGAAVSARKCCRAVLAGVWITFHSRRCFFVLFVFVLLIHPMSNIPRAARDICGGAGIGRAIVVGRSAGSDVGGTFGTFCTGGTGGVMSGRTCISTQHATTSKPGRAVVKPIGEMFRERDAVRAAKRPPTADTPAGLAAAASAAPPNSGKPSIARKRTKKANTANSHGTASVQHRRHSDSGDDDDYGNDGDDGDYGDYGDDGGGEDDKSGWRKKEKEGKGDWCNDDDGDDDAGSEEEEDEEHSSDRDFIAPTEEEDEEEPDNRSSGSTNKPQLVNDDDDDGLIGGLCQNLEAQARRTCHAPEPKKHKHGDKKKKKRHIKKPNKLKKTTKSHKHRVRKKPRCTRVILSDNGSDGSDGSDGGAAASLTGQCRIPAHTTIQTSRSDRALHTSTLSSFRAETTTVTVIPVETMASLVQRLAGTLRTMCAACSDVTAAMQRASAATALPGARCLPAALVFGTTDARSSVSIHRMSQYVAQLQRAGAEHTKHLRAASRCAMQQQRSNPRGAFTNAAPLIAPLIAAPAIAAAPFSCNEHMRITSPCTRVSLPSQLDNAVPNSRPVATHVKPVPAATDNEYTDAELADVLGANSGDHSDDGNTNKRLDAEKNADAEHAVNNAESQHAAKHAEADAEADAEETAENAKVTAKDNADAESEHAAKHVELHVDETADNNAEADAKVNAGQDKEKAESDADQEETMQPFPNEDTADTSDGNAE